MMQRTGAHEPSSWAPPGGKVEDNEAPAQTVVREVKEETNLAIKDPVFIGFTNDIFAADDLHYITLCYVVKEPLGSEIITEPHKCLEQKWCSIDELPEPLFLPTKNLLKDAEAVKKLKNIIASTL